MKFFKDFFSYIWEIYFKKFEEDWDIAMEIGTYRQ